MFFFFFFKSGARSPQMAATAVEPASGGVGRRSEGRERAAGGGLGAAQGARGRARRT